MLFRDWASIDLASGLFGLVCGVCTVSWLDGACFDLQVGNLSCVYSFVFLRALV